ncbi:MAG TPA: ABC transporter permease [Gemmatimonadales bacterium]|nr:ABC transporter permease [Gemmatimonadales bacterium]
MRLHSISEGWLIAVTQLRANKLRSALTILGVVIGVATVMAMASIVQGIRDQIINTIEVAGPTTFYIMRFWSTTPLNPDALPKEVRIRPVIKPAEAEAIGRLPDIHYAGTWVQLFQKMEYGGVHTQIVTIFGADDHYMEIQGGSLPEGRFFTTAEQRTGTPSVVLERRFADKLFGRVNPLGRVIRISGKAFQVIGIYQNPENIFQPPSQEIAAIIPFEAARRFFRYDETNALWIVVKPNAGVTVSHAMDEVTVQLRRLRGLRAGAPNSFDLITQDQILDVFNKLTGVFFLVMLVLSSVALLVGGIGVMAIMMVSVTDRTREIGVRKALGATRREILWQFLVEAATLTLLGGVLGIVLGLGFGQLLRVVMSLELNVPVWSAVVACTVSIIIGLVFGIAPAARAAKLDPVEALRYE